MRKYTKLVFLIFAVFFIILVSDVNISKAQEKPYRRIFPESVSPKPDEIQVRDSREKMKADVAREKQLLESKQKGLTPEGEPARPTGEPTETYYRISVDDRLLVTVWRITDLSLEVIVGPDGYISYPLIGDIRAAGKTLSELDAEITEKLKVYVEDPQVSVVVREFAGQQVTVVGEVRSPGIYKYTGKTRIMDIVALAGGFTDRAQASIVIVREHEDPQKDVNLIVVNINQILRGRYKRNIEVEPYDIVYVSRTFISNVKEFYDNWIVPAVDKFLDYESYKSIRRTRHR